MAADDIAPSRAYGLRDPATIKKPTPAGEHPSSSSANTAVAAARPKARPYKPGQPDRNLDPALPRSVRVERTGVIFETSSSSSEEENQSPAASSTKKKNKKASKGKGPAAPPKPKPKSNPASKTRLGAEEADFDDPTDDDDRDRDRTPPAAQPKVYVDLTADSQEIEEAASSPDKAGATGPSRPLGSKSAPARKGNSTKSKPRKITRKEQSPEEALDAAKKAWAAAHATAEKEAIEASKSGEVGRRTPSSVYLYFKEPIIYDHNTKGEGIGFWCTGCCATSQLVWRPFSESSTSNLRSHIGSKSSLANRVALAKQGVVGPMDSFLKKGTISGGSAEPHITPAQARQIAVEWVTSSSRPLSIVEDKGFGKLLSAEVRSMMPGRKVLSDDVVRIYNSMLDVIKERLAAVEGCFHIALDVWTSKNGHAFLAMIVNYQEQGQAKRHLLNMIPFLASHDAKNMSNAVWKTIERAGITERLWNIVSDNASENSAMLPLLSRLGGSKARRFRGKASQVRCMAHICNLISKAVANTFVNASTSVRQKHAAAAASAGQKGYSRRVVQVEPEEWPSDDEDETDTGAASEEEEDDSEGASHTSGNGSAADDGNQDEDVDDVLDEPDDAISSSLYPQLAANQADDEEIREILAGPAQRARQIQTPSSSAATSADPSTTPTPSAAAADEQEQELRNGEVGLHIKKLAWLSKKVFFSPKARRIWKRECRQQNLDKPWTLIRDVATRWDSTQKMIERGLKLWTAVISFSEKNPDIVPDNLRLRRADRSTFDSLLEILTPMAKATARFSKKTRPMIGEVVGMFERLDSVFSTIEDDKARPDAWRKAAERARKVVSKYYGLSEQTEVYSLAVLLHPNYRLEFLEAMKWEEDWKEAAIDVLRTTFNNFYKIQPVESQDDDASQNDEEEEEDDPVTLAMMKRSLTRKAQAKVTDPIDEWLADVTPLNKKKETVDPLAWWWKEKVRGNERMGLADLALDVFSCPATSVDVERLFSRAGRNVTSLRNSMKARKLAKVVAVGQWFLDDWVPTDLLQRVLQAENEAKVRAREAKRRKRVADEDAAKKRRKTNNGQTAADGDD